MNESPMLQLIQAVLNSDEKNDLRNFLSQLRADDRNYLLRTDVLSAFDRYCLDNEKDDRFRHRSAFSDLVASSQEIIKDQDSFCLLLRPRIATQSAHRILADLTVEKMSVEDLLNLRDRLVERFHPQEGATLEIDFKPFYDYYPPIKDPKNIGKGAAFLNRYLSSKLFQSPEQWFQSLFKFLRSHHYNGTQLLLNGRIQSQWQLSQQAKQALTLLAKYPDDRPYREFRYELQELGFEPGWGNTAGRVSQTLDILDGLLDSPDHQSLEAFLSRIPMIFRIVLVSVNGWFGQEGVLGRPDTGGQVVYVLDQARSLEKQLQQDITLAGLDELKIRPKLLIVTRLIAYSEGTFCNQRLEKLRGSDDVWILRVPFREHNPNVTRKWLSRFELWPYLETFAIDAETEIKSELGGKPDLIVGNYTDGNLVAFLLSRSMKVIQCYIAHSLEKPKYLFSNLYWQDLESKYHFSLQFTADLIAMNACHFIVSSTYQEIAGTTESIGQYESYQSFTMPELYHVHTGIDLFSPKFNLVPPGVSEQVFFPYTKTENRVESDRQRLNQLLFTYNEAPTQIFGVLEDPDKRPIFSIGRMDRIKNMSGLAECFGQSEALQEQCNLIIIAGKLRLEDSQDQEEREEIEKLYGVIDRYNLHGKIRWLAVRLSRIETGEIYRIIADRQGIFIQPALFEAFGLTVLEAMITGLPSFATQFGGSLEIIQDQVSGFYINPANYEETAEKIADFLTKCEHNPTYWHEISGRAIDRVYSKYTWSLHSKRLLSLARTYGFWNYTSKDNREDMLRYIEMLFHLLYKPRARELLDQHSHWQ
nr:sucrose synthase [Pseudanabaena sp. PCC 7367]